MDNHQQPSEERQVRVSQHKAQQAHQQVLAPPLHRAPPQAQHPLAPPQAHHPLLLPLLQNPFFHFPATTMVTKTTQITETHRSSNIVQVTQYSTEVLTVSPSTTSKSSTSSSSKSSSQTPIVSTKIEQTTAYSIKTVNGTQTQEIKTLYITQFTTQSTLDSTTGTTSFESASISNLRSQDASVAPTLSVSSSSTTDSPRPTRMHF